MLFLFAKGKFFNLRDVIGVVFQPYSNRIAVNASNALSPSALTIENLVTKIFDSHVKDQQLDETDLTLSDLSRVASEFERILSGLHHRRIDYPGFDFDDGLVESHLQVVGRS